MIGPKKTDYHVDLVWDKKSGGEARFRNHPTIKFDMPIEFGGEGRFPCPDELFLSSIGGCLLTTFLYFKRRFKIFLEGLNISVKGNVELMGPEGYRVTRLTADIHVKTSSDEEAKAKRFAEWIKDYCHITRSMEQGLSIEISTKVTCTKKPRI